MKKRLIGSSENVMMTMLEEMKSDDVSLHKQGMTLLNFYEEGDRTKKELMDNILITLCGYSMESLVAKSGAVLADAKQVNMMIDAAAIGYWLGHFEAEGKADYNAVADVGFIEAMQEIIELVGKFHSLGRYTEDGFWNDCVGDYYEVIDAFAEKELLERFGTEQSTQSHSSIKHSMLELSTAHLTLETRKMLNDDDGVLSRIAYDKATYGWFIYVPEEENEGDHLPADIKRILSLARENKCKWVMIDRDGHVNESLQTFE